MNNDTSPVKKTSEDSDKRVEVVEEIYHYSVIKKEDLDYYNAKELKVKKIVRKLL